MASPFQQARVQRIVDGREVWIDQRLAQVASVARSGQRLSTGRSRAELLFDRRAIGFLGRSSQITLGARCFRLLQGTVLVNGNQPACLGSRVLGVRGTTYVLEHLPEGGWDVAVLTGEATVADAALLNALVGPTPSEEEIESLFPRLRPLVGLAASGSSGTGTGSGNERLLGEVDAFLPLQQSRDRRLLYSYSLLSAGSGDRWGGTSELGVRWFDPNNTATSGLLLGVDGWRSANSGCFHSQLALGGQWQRRGWQWLAEGAVNLDDCADSLSHALVGVGIPLGEVAEQPIQLRVSPYLLNALGRVTVGARLGLSLPLSESLALLAYGQSDDLLGTVVGGRLSVRFGVGGSPIRDPNRGSPSPLADGKRQGEWLQAGETARFDASGRLLRRGRLGKARYEQLLLLHLSGQNLLPESALIERTHRRLYGRGEATVRAITGGDWRILERLPLPRLRAGENFVVPASKLPAPRPAAKPPRAASADPTPQPPPPQPATPQPPLPPTPQPPPPQPPAPQSPTPQPPTPQPPPQGPSPIQPLPLDPLQPLPGLSLPPSNPALP